VMIRAHFPLGQENKKLKMHYQCIISRFNKKVLVFMKYNALLKVILHQFWVKKIFPWKFNLEYDGTFTKLFMHVSSWNMFPTTRNLQIHVHVYRPRHYFRCFVPMIADHNLVKKSFCTMIADHELVKKR
jgi:hypothetical protein